MNGIIEVEFEGINYEVEYDPMDGVISICVAPESKDQDLVDALNMRTYNAIVRKIESN